MSTTRFSNGPLPDFLQSDAVITEESNEFMLGPDAALQYLDWCLRGDLPVVGMEAFQKGPEGVLAVDDASCDAGAHECKQCISRLVTTMGNDILFSIWVPPEQ